VSRPHSSLWTVPFMAVLALGGGACAVGESPGGGESAGSGDDTSDREQPDGDDEGGGDVDGGAGDQGDGPPGPDGSDEVDPPDDGQGGDGEDGAGIVCPVCDDEFALCSSTAATPQDSLSCEWQWVRCALPGCDLGDARQCFIALDTCFQLCQTLSECVACSLAGQECYY
jgi:hypothetical protein